VAFAWDGRIGVEEGVRHPKGHVVLTGRLAKGGTLEGASQQAVDGFRDATTGRHVFRFATGASVEGRLQPSVRHPDGRLMRVHLKDVRLALPGRESVDLAEYVLVSAGVPVTAHAGAADPKFHSDTAFSSVTIPRHRALPLREQRLQALYEQAERGHRAGLAGMQGEFPRLLAALGRDYPYEWLLRWNLLESLLKAGDDGRTAHALRADLERLELQFDHREPIASGLRYLSGRAA
jgi:hypothetical protein